ncbi:hypothetical protein Q8W71_24945 [Methylobacterium sp. NEAU 140]|uniref:hypothetical protein n=1 Tax=Methylobacterium sp. NEAU 140 TaxID=3064945 RepID=UPI0027337C8E|nr:hypothetical protein [Methylobacterium sp. NEAU 140]MDP4025883.1 hypothetical protein [Methylobacterium sp. NEAU 140]
MAVNRFRSHVFILPEDDANRQLAVGFALEFDSRQIQVLREAGGWLNVCKNFESDHVQAMRNCPHRAVILLIDFDEDPDRRRSVGTRIPADLTERVFVLGTWSEPEALRRSLAATYEEIGRALARGCRQQDGSILQGELLRHNGQEIERVCAALAAVS